MCLGLCNCLVSSVNIYIYIVISENTFQDGIKTCLGVLIYQSVVCLPFV